MSLNAYARGLAQAALDSAHASIHDANAMERFVRRHRWMFGAEDYARIEAAVSVGSWARVAWEVRQERREMAGLPADPKRLSRHPTASGMGVRAILLPSYFLVRSRPRSRQR